MENGEENDERAYKYNKTQKRHPDHGKPDRSGKAAASDYAGAILLGTAGYLCAIFLTILAGQIVVQGLITGAAGIRIPLEKLWLASAPVKTILIIMLVIAVLRGILHYAEQYCNHFIAFKLLAIIRHKVFAARESFVRRSWREEIREI